MWAIAAAVVAGILAAFFQITGAITVTTVFLWVALGVALAGLGVLLGTAGRCCRTDDSTCVCAALNALLTGLVGTALFAVVLLAFGIVATSVVSAILVGLLVLSLTLAVGSAACYIRAQADCGT